MLYKGMILALVKHTKDFLLIFSHQHVIISEKCLSGFLFAMCMPCVFVVFVLYGLYKSQCITG